MFSEILSLITWITINRLYNNSLFIPNLTIFYKIIYNVNVVAIDQYYTYEDVAHYLNDLDIKKFSNNINSMCTVHCKNIHYSNNSHFSFNYII